MYLNAVQLAESLGVAESVVESWVRDEALPCVRDGHRMLFDRAQVVAWAAGRGLVARAGFLAPERARSVSGRLERWLRAGGIWRDVSAADVRSTLGRVVAALPGTSADVRHLLGQRLHAPGGITWAAVGGGLALPHLRAHVALGRDAGILGLVFLREPLPAAEEDLPDGEPITRLLFFIAPTPRAHLEILAQLSTGLSRGRLRELVLNAAPDAEILSAMGELDAGVAERTVPKAR